MALRKSESVFERPRHKSGLIKSQPMSKSESQFADSGDRGVRQGVSQVLELPGPDGQRCQYGRLAVGPCRRVISRSGMVLEAWHAIDPARMPPEARIFFQQHLTRMS